MKNKLFASLTLAVLSTLNSELPTLAQGTAFTYQGRLNDGANAANGSYNLRFALFDALTVGNQIGSPLTNSPVNVTNGLFTVTLDFGGSFPGADRWLEIGVRTNGSGAFFTLSPRQKITPAPYAIFAGTVNANGLAAGTYANAVTLNNPANSFSGDGAALTNVNAATLGGLGAANIWIVGGNAGTGGAGLGTVDSQPLKLIAGNRRALHLESRSVSLGLFDSWSAVNTLGGASGNIISNGVMGGTIAGGGAVTNHLFGSEAAPNAVLDNFSTVGGGINNTAGFASANFDDARSATVAGGEGNTASGAWATVGGGQMNSASGNFLTTVAGGENNTASGDFAAVGGGGYNVSSGSGATVPGGVANYAIGFASFAAGHQAQALHDGTFVWADNDPSFNSYVSTGTNQFCIRARGGIQVDPQTSMYFGNSVRQMLNLFGNFYGIGVQSFTMYFRTDGNDGGFSWFKGGVHNDNQNNPGGGTELMRLDTGGNLKTLTGTIASLSDRNAKTGFQPVDSQSVLACVAALPISTWRYKNADPSQRHLGPMAQDFYGAFGVGLDDKSICTVDEGGVALAAIQGLNQKLEQDTVALRSELNRKDVEIQQLRQRLDALENILVKQK